MSYPQPEKIPIERAYVYDYTTGDIIDPLTGEVVDRIYVYQVVERDKETGEYIGTAEVTPVSDPMHPLYLGSSRYDCLRDIMYLLAELRNEVRLAISDYDMEMSLRHLLKRLSKHTYTREFKVSLLAIALEMWGIPVDNTLLSKVFNIPVSILKSKIMRLKRELHEIGYNVGKSDPKEKILDYIRTIGAQLNLPHEVILSAMKTVHSKPYPSRYTPKTIAVALLYCEIEKRNINITNRVPGCKSNLRALMKLAKVAQSLTKPVEFVKNYYYK